MDNFYLNMQKTIAEHGRQVMAVPFDGGGMFSYTIGNHENGIPEFVIVKFGQPELQCMILNAVSETIKAKLAEDDMALSLIDGNLLDIEFSMPVKLVKASEKAKDDLTIQAGQYLKTEGYDLYQVILPDESGKFQGNEGFNAKWEVPLV